MIMSDCDLTKLLESGQLIIDPLSKDTIQQNGIDFKIGNEIGERTRNAAEKIIDSKSTEDIKNSFLVTENESDFILSPLQHYLLTTKERIRMPDNLMGFCGLRSTFARLGFVSPMTVIDAGFEGTLTIGIFYGGNSPIKVSIGTRFLHVVFAQLKTKTEIPYEGYYKMQKGVSIPKSL